MSSKRLNLLIFSTDYKPNTGGIAEHTYQIAKHFDQQGDNVIVVAPKVAQAKLFDRRQNFKTHRVPNAAILRVFLFIVALLYLKRRFRIEYVYCAITHPCGELCWLFSLVFNLKYIISVHGYEILYSNDTLRSKIKKKLKFLRTHIYNKSHRIFAVSNYTKHKLVESGVRPSNIMVFNNGINLEKFKSSAKGEQVIEKYGLQNNKIILTISRLVEHKGHDMVIKGLPVVLKEIPKIVYLIAGKGYYEPSLRSLVRELNLEDHVIFLGFISDEELPKWSIS